MSQSLKKIDSEYNQTASILNEVFLFSGIKENWEALETVAKMMTLETHKAFDKLIEEGENGDRVYILISGQVSIYKKTLDGDLYKVAILKGENFPAFGEGGLIDAEARSATIICDESSECLVLTREDFKEFSLSCPHWALPVYQNISRSLILRLKKMNQDMTLLHKALTNEIKGN